MTGGWKRKAQQTRDRGRRQLPLIPSVRKGRMVADSVSMHLGLFTIDRLILPFFTGGRAARAPGELRVPSASSCP
jgi:hypothetical protein